METTARGDVPKTLQTIAYISIPNSADLEFLLWDLQDAIAAYAQLSGTTLPRPIDLKADNADGVFNANEIIRICEENLLNPPTATPVPTPTVVTGPTATPQP